MLCQDIELEEMSDSKENVLASVEDHSNVDELRGLVERLTLLQSRLSDSDSDSDHEGYLEEDIKLCFGVIHYLLNIIDLLMPDPEVLVHL